MYTNSSNTNSSIWATALTHGLILALAGSIYSLILFFLGIDVMSPLSYLSFVIIAIILFWAISNYRDQNLGGKISYGQVLGYGLLVSLIGGIFSAVYMLFYTEILDPDFAEQTLLQVEEMLIQEGQSDEVIDDTIAISAKFYTPFWWVLGSIINYLVFGFLFSLIAGFLIKAE